MLVGVLSQIESFSDTYFVSQMTLISFCCFPSSIIINIAAMLHVFVRYLLYLLLLQCLFPGENKELNWNHEYFGSLAKQGNIVDMWERCQIA